MLVWSREGGMSSGDLELVELTTRHMLNLAHITHVMPGRSGVYHVYVVASA